MDNISHLLLQQIISKFGNRLEMIGEVLEGKIAERVANLPIYDKGEFYRKLTHQVISTDKELTLKFWSTAPHAPFVLGGKVPSWTPYAPLKSWVERKVRTSGSFVSKFSDNGKLMPIDSITWLIRSKIRREGIKERNVIMDVIKDELNWIEKIINETDLAGV